MTVCSCGANQEPHSVGSASCLREPCPSPVSLGDDLWQVDGGTPINTFTLTNTRLYSEHEDGTWSRPRRPVSQCSLQGEW